jgi:hypothetical protein
MTIRQSATLLAALSLAACASGSSAGGDTAAAPRRNSTVITAQEIAAATGASTAYDVVRQLRPAWLVERGIRGTGGAAAPGALTSTATEGPAGVVVYRDGTRLGGFSELQNIPAETVGEIRWLDGRDATQRFGTGHGAGAIEITSKR